MTQQLYMFYIGGDCGGSNIELHDIRFSVGEMPQDCYEDLRRQWWGDAKSLHLDSWGAVQYADGYRVAVTKDAAAEPSPLKLFFLNMGGYNGVDFEELHKNLLIVEETQHKAIVKAMKTIREWKLPHRDAVMEIEKVISVSDVLADEGYRIALEKCDSEIPFEFTSKYVRINIEQFQ